jgi:hypothetical protein
MYIGYSSELATLRARNPRAEIEMSYLPQTRGYDSFETGVKMYGIATLTSSKNVVVGLNVQSQFAGAGIAPTIANITGGVPPFRSYAGTQGINIVLAKSMLVAKGWYDLYSNESTTLIYSMLADIISGRQGVTDAASTFVSRLRELYTHY